MDLEGMKQYPYRSIMRFAIPSVIGMLLTSLITIVDGIFIGKYVGREGLAAVNIGIPVLYLLLGITIMIGVGGSTLAIQKLGEKEFDKANNIFRQSIVTLIFAVVLISFCTKILLHPILEMTKLDSLVSTYINNYYSIMLSFYPIMMLNIGFGMFIRGEGKPQIFMQISILTNAVNIMLDYFFTHWLSMGIQGVAYASGVSIILGFGICLFYFLNKKSSFKFGKFKFTKEDFKTTIYNGSSELIGQLSMAITTMLYNVVILNVIGVMGVAAMTIIGYVGHVYNMIIIGIGQGMSPIVSYSYGANDNKLVVGIRQRTQKIVFTCGIIVFATLLLAGNRYVRVFSNDINLQHMVANGIKIYAFAFLINGYNIISSFFYTSVGRAKESAIISSLRGLIILSLSIILLPMIFKELGIWLAVPITEVITFFVSMNMNRVGECHENI